MSATPPPAVRRTARFLGRSQGRTVTPENAASRVTAFVYGNILVMAALVALHPHDLLEPKAVAYVAGTGVSTFVAHVLAESVGSRVRTGRRPTGQHLRHEVRDSVPIVSSTTVPLVLMGAALPGWLDPALALQIAIGVTVLRLAALGWVVERLQRRRASVRTFVSGVLLATACLGAAVLKGWLTH